MHVYIYDDFLSKNKYQKTLNKIEIRLTDLGLNGKIVRLANIKDVEGAIQNEIRKGAKNIIAVGNDNTLSKIVNSIADDNLSYFLKENLSISIIPVGEPNDIAYNLGIKNYSKACNIILARRIKTIDIMQANDFYFIYQGKINNKNTNIQIDENCYLQSEESGEIRVINIINYRLQETIPKSSPSDNLLDLYIQTNKRGAETHFSLSSFQIKNQKDKVLLDNSQYISSPVNFSNADKKINFIVGKDRSFD